MFAPLIRNQADRPLANLRRIPRRMCSHHNSSFSQVGASGRASAVQPSLRLRVVFSPSMPLAESESDKAPRRNPRRSCVQRKCSKTLPRRRQPVRQTADNFLVGIRLASARTWMRFDESTAQIPLVDSNHNRYYDHMNLGTELRCALA